MEQLQLTDLHNPEKVKAIFTSKEGYIEAGPDQGFQCLPKRVELWQKLEDGRLLKVKGWTTTVIATYN